MKAWPGSGWPAALPRRKDDPEVVDQVLEAVSRHARSVASLALSSLAISPDQFGVHQQMISPGQTEGHRRLEIDDQVIFGWQLHRQVSRLDFRGLIEIKGF
jgi:hypothetical protein